MSNQGQDLSGWVELVWGILKVFIFLRVSVAFVSLGLPFLLVPYLLTLLSRLVGYYPRWKALLLSVGITGVVAYFFPDLARNAVKASLSLAQALDDAIMLKAGGDSYLKAPLYYWAVLVQYWRPWLEATWLFYILTAPIYIAGVFPFMKWFLDTFFKNHIRLFPRPDPLDSYPAWSFKTARNGKKLQAGTLIWNDSVALGLNPQGKIRGFYDRTLNAHTLVLGATGSGKTMTLLTMMNQAIGRQPIIFVDLKGDPDLVFKFRNMCAHRGVKFEYWDLEGKSGNQWNPLNHGNATELKDKIMALEDWTEPHYKALAERYLGWVFNVVTAAGDTPTLKTVVTLMNPANLENYAAQSDKLPNDVVDGLRFYLDSLRDVREIRGSLAGLEARLAVLVESEPGKWLQGNDIDITRTIQTEGVLLFSLASMKYPGMASKIGALVVQDLANVADMTMNEIRKHPGRYVYIVLDEFSALHSNNIENLLQRGRGAHYNVILSTQELADLDRKDSNLKDTALTNCQTKIIGRQDNPATCEALARMTGTKTVFKITEATDMTGNVTGMSRRAVEEFRVHPNYFKRVPRGSVIVINNATGLVERVEVVIPREKFKAPSEAVPQTHKNGVLRGVLDLLGRIRPARKEAAPTSQNKR